MDLFCFYFSLALLVGSCKLLIKRIIFAFSLPLGSQTSLLCTDCKRLPVEADGGGCTKDFLKSAWDKYSYFYAPTMLEKHHLGQAIDLHYNINGKLLELKG